ncbi:MAG: GNAT family N-acetyltransferase [Pseudomonadota bacterium]
MRARCAHDGEPIDFVEEAFFAEQMFGSAAALRAVVVDRGEEGRLGGLCLFHIAYEAVYSARGSYVAELFVDPDLRRQGLARALLAETARACRVEGGVYLWWTAGAANHVARAFYGEIADLTNSHSVFYAVTREAFDRLCHED